MRRSRRNGHGGLEFGGSGEDSFVAVVVTKLTGALLFILLLTMVIMALLPKAVDVPLADTEARSPETAKLAIVTPETLPEAIAGRPYTLALAAQGGHGPLQWAIDGKIPEGLTFDAETAQIRGTPKAGTPEPQALVLRVSDGASQVSRGAQLVVYKSDQPLSLPSKWKPNLPPIPWHAWLEQGFGFLVLWLVHLVGMSTLGNLQRWSLGRVAAIDSPDTDAARAEEASFEAAHAVRRRFAWYKLLVRLATLSAACALAIWLARPRP
jgi:Putative Ig domain